MYRESAEQRLQLVSQAVVGVGVTVVGAVGAAAQARTHAAGRPRRNGRTGVHARDGSSPSIPSASIRRLADVCVCSVACCSAHLRATSRRLALRLPAAREATERDQQAAPPPRAPLRRCVCASAPRRPLALARAVRDLERGTTRQAPPACLALLSSENRTATRRKPLYFCRPY